MSFTPSALADGVNGITANATQVGFFTADPGSTGANETTGGGYARQASTFPTATAASPSSVGSQVVTPIAAGVSLTHWGLFKADGTFKGGWPLAAPESFGSAGQMKFTPTVSLA